MSALIVRSDPTACPARTIPGGWITAAIASLHSRLRERMRQRATQRILESLDDRTLRDIGIDRAEIASAVKIRQGRCRYPDAPHF